jgi:5-methylcytosine-specific restriction endonuclease McrA
MSDDPYYRSAAWRRLRAYRLKLDRHICTVEGCGRIATHVDHIVSRRDGGADEVDNLRSLCAQHDNQVKEGADGERRRDGKLRAIGCDAQGRPRDPGHWWNVDDHAPKKSLRAADQGPARPAKNT